MTEHLLAGGLYWTELRIILQVARSRSFNKAADELGVSHPTVARAVRLRNRDRHRSRSSGHVLRKTCETYTRGRARASWAFRETQK